MSEAAFDPQADRPLVPITAEKDAHAMKFTEHTRSSSATSPCSRSLAFIAVTVGGMVEIAPLLLDR